MCFQLCADGLSSLLSVTVSFFSADNMTRMGRPKESFFVLFLTQVRVMCSAFSISVSHRSANFDRIELRRKPGGNLSDVFPSSSRCTRHRRTLSKMMDVAPLTWYSLLHLLRRERCHLSPRVSVDWLRLEVRLSASFDFWLLELHKRNCQHIRRNRRKIGKTHTIVRISRVFRSFERVGSDTSLLRADIDTCPRCFFSDFVRID